MLIPSMMAFDQETKQSVTENPVPSNEASDASTTDIPSTKATPTKTERLESNALPNSDADPAPENLEKAEIGTFALGRSKNPSLSDIPKASPAAASESKIQINTTKAEHIVSVETVPAAPTGDPLAVVVRHAGQEDAKAPAEGKMSAQTPGAKYNNYITLKHYDGKDYMLPWALCET